MRGLRGTRTLNECSHISLPDNHIYVLFWLIWDLFRLFQDAECFSNKLLLFQLRSIHMSTQTLRSSPKPAKPWSSGRMLSSAQREAKRQKDRITKRTKTQEQKNRIDDLEGRIKNLQNFIQAHLGT